MKRSEFETRMGAEWDLSTGAARFISRETHIALKREGAEAAGVKWDPEEPKLPERLGVAESSFSGRCELFPAGVNLWPSTEIRLASYQKAASRYNAWPELEKLAGGTPFDTLEGVLASLRELLGSGK